MGDRINEFKKIAAQSNGNYKTYVDKLSNLNLENKDILPAIRAFNEAQSQISNIPTTGGGKTKSTGVIGSFVEAFKETLKTQEGDNSYLPDLKTQMIGIDDVFNKITNSQGNLNNGLEITKSILTSALSYLGDYYKEQTTLLGFINKEAGLTAQFSKDFREEITNANPRLVQLGISYSDLAESAKNLVEQTGRFALINQQTFERAGEISRAYVGSLQDLVKMYTEFEKVGLGAADAQEKIALAGKKSLDLGLQSQKTTKELALNIGKLNEYGFKNGIDGLSTMVRKATEFRMSMQEVFNIAEKVMNPEGALELTANLQVLGGAIGDFNDPLKLMYMATNNVEGLQDALIGAAGSLATYNTEQKRFEITGVNLRRAKEMAASLGISFQELTKGAIAAAERSSAAADLMARGLTLSDEQQEFLTNIAQMKGGKMVIELNSDRLKSIFKTNEIALENITESQAKEILKYQDEFKKMSAEDIIRKQATDIDNIKKDLNFIALLARNRAGALGQRLFEESGASNVLKNAAQTTRTYTKESARPQINQIETGILQFSNMIKEGFNKIFNVDNIPTQKIEEQKKKTTQNTPSTASLTKDDIGDAFYNSLVKFESFKKKPETNIAIQTMKSGDYFINEPISS